MISSSSSLSETFLKKGFWLYFFSFIIAPTGYVIKILISQDLSVAEVGILYGIISLVTLLGAFSDFGIKESLSYFIPRFHEEGRHDKSKLLLLFGFYIQCITGVIIFSIFYFGAPYLATYYFQSEAATEVLQVFAFFFIGLNLFQLVNSFFLAVQNTFLQKGLEMLRMGFVMFAVIGIFFSGVGELLSYAYAWIGGLYVGVFVSLVIFFVGYYPRYLKEEKVIWDRGLMKEIFAYALVTFFTVQSFFILSQIDMQMVLLLLGPQDAGYYTNYLSLVSIPNTLIGPIFLLLFPLFSSMHARKDYEKIRSIKYIFQKQFLVLSLAFSVLLFVLAKPLSTLLFGDKFLMSGIILQFAVLMLVWNFLLRINQIILASTGRARERLRIVLISIVINIILNFIGISLFGVAGAALATGISWIIVWYISEFMMPEYRVGFDIKYIATNGVFFFLSGTILLGLILPLFSDITRLMSFFLFLSVSAVYFSLFAAWNFGELRKFYSEIRKLRKHS
ncbi:oligosaccharide flippase family protein [Candidatus Gracilibacteria bacterium]|nr:oligosaccharide flippase family protein [Candidatus Gracilibacteria bacterium]